MGTATNGSNHLDERRVYQILSFEPELDMTCAPLVKRRLETAAADDARLYVLDLSGVKYLDSTIISLIASFRERMHARGAVVRVLCIGRSEHLVRLFQITGLDRFFTIYTTLQAALELP